jgi:hypothetical protein
MKNLLITTLLALAGLFPVAAANDKGHVLNDLWDQYEEARKADRPQKEAEILAEIRQKAQRQHLPVDFYDAATLYVNTVQRRDWKQGDALREELQKEVERFNDPMVTFLWMREWKRASTNEIWTYVKDHAKDFKGHHPALHRGVDSFLNGALKPFIRSDKEFALWNLLGSSRSNDALQEELYKALKADLNGSYPGDGALEYYLLSRKYNQMADRPQKKAALQALQNQYTGKALGLFPEADLLLLQKEDLDETKADEKQYKDLDGACKLFENRRKGYTGAEATLAKACTGVSFLMSWLEEEGLDVLVDSSRIQVLFRNLYHANLTLREGKRTIKTWKVANFDRSFYVQDTVSVDLPELPDGDYTVEAVSGKHSVQEEYTRYTLSLAVRQDALGRSVYVADYKTGEPLPMVSFRLLKGDTEVAGTSLRMNGFTLLPEAFVKPVSQDRRTYYSIQAVSGDRRSQPLILRSGSDLTRDGKQVQCHIYKDQGAYHPGDTVRFKAILYESEASHMSVCKGKSVNVFLRDQEDKVIETLRITTNEWGSVSGRFVLPKGHKNGYFSLEVEGLCYDWFRVDEFALPAFTLRFDSVEQVFLPGDEIPVSGSLISYSGHNLTGAKALLQVTRNGSIVYEEEQTIGSDNRFFFAFQALETGYYKVRVRVVDGTGETQEFSDGHYVTSSLAVYPRFPDEVENASGAQHLIGGKQLNVVLEVYDGSGYKSQVPVTYQLYSWKDALLAQGTIPSGETLSLSLPGSGVYKLHTQAEVRMKDGTPVKGESKEEILCLLPGEEKLPEGALKVFLPMETTVPAGGSIAACLGHSQGKIYAQVALYGENWQLLESRPMIVEKGQLGRMGLPYLDSYPDAVRLEVFYFFDGGVTHERREFRRQKAQHTLPLSFSRFQDKAFPGTLYSFKVKTEPGAEALVAAWDKSLDAVAKNDWRMVSTQDVSVPFVPTSSICGTAGRSRPRLKYSLATKGVNRSSAMVSDAISVEEVAAEGLPFQSIEMRVGGDKNARADFSTALTFQPHLRPSADGTLEFSFRTSDKLSTYYVRVYAHDKEMHNAVCEKEMVVSLPVKVSLLEPRCLYAGDVYEAAVTVSSVADKPVSGVIMLKAGESVQQIPVTVNPGATETRRFTVKIPDQVGDDEGSSFSAPTGNLVLTASFVASEFSDAVQVTVPVYPAAQVLTEAHSAVLRDGTDRNALLEELRSRFVNVPASEATLREITVLDLVKDAIPSHVDPRGDDVLSLSEAWYTGLMASVIPGTEGVSVSPHLLEKILACQNGDGGFAWFPGMNSNAIITAVLLERFALLRDRGFEVPDVTKAVKFLDSKQFGAAFPVWNGWVSDAQYMRVRALYPEVPFEVKPVSATEKKRLAEFKKYAKEYLTPSRKSGRGLEGQILSKARRLLTLRCLNASAQGKALAGAWGIGLSSKLEKSIQADVTSLLEYAVEHRDGGWYYPNAVMPFRGLLESEAYAHALLCQLLSVIPSKASVSPSVIADGIRLWLMLQKETQKWDTDPAFVDAITAILDGSEVVLNTRVLALSATYEAPFENIQASGNGFTVERKFYKMTDKWEPLLPNETVKVGDKIKVVYAIWNAENRSFVKLTAGREASLRPVEQLSGYVGFYRGYRNVKASATEFYFDSYPEEKTELSEEFFVTQAGRFVAPVTVIESLYAPHYRANSAFRPPLVVAQ